jgi:hypothetical protein
MNLEGYIQFENKIPVLIDCLDQKYPISISGINGFLFTPKMFSGFNEISEHQLGPLQSPSCGEVKYTNNFYWGSVNSWPKGNSEIQTCSIIFPDIDEDEFEVVANLILNCLEEWRNLLVDNINVALQGNYSGISRIINSTGSSFIGYTLFKKSSGTNNEFITKKIQNQSISVVILNIKGFNQKSLQKILDETSLKKIPLLPFYFFLDAEKAELESNYRKSILDSATAIEVCFSMIIAKHLPSQNKFNKYIFSKHYSLSQKRDLLKALEVSLPFTDKEYIVNIDKIRNRVIHGGYSPNTKEIVASLRITRQTIYTLLPLKYEI